MRKRGALLCIVAFVMSATLAHAAAPDIKPPTTAFQTKDMTIVANLYPAYEDLVGGYADDDLSGIGTVRVIFTGVVTKQTFSFLANIGCFDAAMRSCMWRVIPPLLPGEYTVTALATDKAGNSQKISPRLTVIVV